MYANDTHTALDHAALQAAGTDPDTSQPRTRPVDCTVCHRVTWNLMRGCDNHYVAPPTRSSS